MQIRKENVSLRGEGMKDTDILDEKNFEGFAEAAIKKYFDSGRMLDGMLWRAIVSYYKAYKEFYDHIKAHFEKEHPDWEVKCKICNKTFPEIIKQLSSGGSEKKKEAKG